ncbi:MarR family winged helix-turn-helix transcriptional regulator [Solicola gregarius]|uniref:MarR family transcriptional regulator n=1 Tax=Solicola gregarius TaxID=2908642 RepID=A0AA46TEZ9_9ACTN|nr:MarR family transcriptional regulator [Solicola gregarius]UYM03587.1 MarR family transcriptional regulator [Solicola gregarius]
MGTDPDCGLAWLELQQATARVRTDLSRRVEADSGMTATEHDVMWALANDVDRRLTMSDIAERAMVTRSGATRLVERLERNGWVRREVDATNRRATYAMLTDEGVRAVRKSSHAVTRARKDLFDERLSDRDLSDLRRVLGKLLRRLDLAD